MSEARLLLEVDGAALDLVDDHVDAGLVRGAGGVTTQGLAVDDQGHLDDVGIVDAPMLLQGQLHDGVAAVVEQPVDAGEASARRSADAIGDVDGSCP